MTMAQPTFKGEKAYISPVAQNKMMEETVKKEMKYHKIVDEFVINPFRKSESSSPLYMYSLYYNTTQTHIM